MAMTMKMVLKILTFQKMAKKDKIVLVGAADMPCRSLRSYAIRRQ